jgi:hypothetical protein
MANEIAVNPPDMRKLIEILIPQGFWPPLPTENSRRAMAGPVLVILIPFVNLLKKLS